MSVTFERVLSMYKIYQGSLLTHSYDHISIDKTHSWFRIFVGNDLPLRYFYTDDPNQAIPEVRRYLKEQWGREQPVSWEWNVFPRESEFPVLPYEESDCKDPEFSRKFWWSHILKQNIDGRTKDASMTRIVIDGKHYYSLPVDIDIPRFLGFGGRRFKIQMFDGREFETTNLWSQGAIPKTYLPFFPDNAKFVENRTFLD